MELDHYCGSPFWDINRTWNTTDPDFTECFENTVLVWSACSFLWIGVIFEILVYLKQNPDGGNTNISTSRLGWTWLGIIKICNVTLVTTLQIGKLFGNWYRYRYNEKSHQVPMPDVYWATPVTLVITHLFSYFLIIFHKRRCVHTSGFQLIHWFGLTVVHSLMFRTMLRDHPGEVNGLALLGIISTLMLFQTFIFCWADIPKLTQGGHTRLMEDNDEEEDESEYDDEIKHEPCPILQVSCLSYILFSYATPFVRKGNREPLTRDDMWAVIPSLKTLSISKVFKDYFGKPEFGEIRSVFRNILKPMWFTCRWPFAIAVTSRLIACLLAFLPPTLMGYLIDFVEDRSIQEWKGYLWAILLFINYLLVTVFTEQFYLHIFIAARRSTNSLYIAIYEKTLRLSSEGKKSKTTGEILNLTGMDTEKIEILMYELDALWATPIQLTIGIILLWKQLGVAVFAGLFVISLVIPINWVLTTVSTKYQRQQMSKKDERIKVISEILGGIQVIKLYAWESPFQSNVKNIRKEEIGILKKRTFIQAGTKFLFDSLPFFVSIAAFFTYIYVSGGELTAKKAFTAVSLFTILTEPIVMLPMCISAAVDATVSFKRINDFLNSEEVDPKATEFEYAHGGKDGKFAAVEVTNGNFAWEELSTSNFQLSDINVKFETGKLTAIVGPVASGKSSLLSGILGDMKKFTGEVIIRGKIAYCPQIPWILNGTLQENICFGKPFNKDKYDKVIDACCLLPDIQILPAGSETEIGEKGINLSGGQKQRVSLARMAYSGADVLLLDDVLSAVDAHVGKRIFDRLLGDNGLLAGTTRILCTHKYNFLSQVSKIVVMDGGQIVESGSYDELMKDGGNFSLLLQNLEQTSKVLESRNSVEEATSKAKSKSESDANNDNDGKLIEEEHLETGDVKLSVFLRYLQAMGYPMTISFIIFFGLSEAVSLGRNVVLSKWTSVKDKNVSNFTTRFDLLEEESPQVGHSDNIYPISYAIFGVSQSFFYLSGFFLVAIATLRASSLLHNNMLARILQAPMSFFNVNLTGRIVNRFSRDVESSDRFLPGLMGPTICYVFQLIGVFVAISYTNLYFIPIVFPVLIVYYVLQRYYIICMQQIQRIVSAAESPIYSQFQETLNGTSTIRAYKQQERFTTMLGRKLDSFVRAFFPHLIVRKWLSIRLGFLGSIVVFIPAIFAVIWRETTIPSLVGLSISYSLQVTNILAWLVQIISLLRYRFVSIERILQYSELEQEGPFETEEKVIGSNWPEKGKIEFVDYETRYRPGLEPVLKHLTCGIEPGEKIGIVGRTGAGKSSLTLALFRIIEGTKGEIRIDGVDIGQVGLLDLRKKLTVIPQDPVLFSRSLRENLDPFGEYEEGKLWEAMRLAHLSKFVEEQPEGLDFKVAEGGENLSVGQRQLVCLARAILRKSTILVLDEATASVDNKTDELIQQTIREHFEGCTILNVAHRLNTVLDSSRIMVLSQGQIVEFDSPQVLLSNYNSHFYGMAKDAGVI